MINLFSDTQSKPTAGMRRAMAEAEVGDEQRGTDPTVNRLCEMSAELMGKEAAVFLPSGTMCNEIAILVHCRPGDEVLCDKTSHIIHAEGGGPAALAGVVMTPLEGTNGVFTAEQPAAPVAAKVGCAKKRAAETVAPAAEEKDTIPAVHRTAPAEEVEEVNTDGKAASIKPCRAKAQDGKLRFGVCDDGETHLFPVLPKRGWKPLPGVASNQHSGSRTAVCRAFPRFARFEGRELELSLPVRGTGNVALMAGKDLNEAEGLQAAKELGRVVVKGEDAVLEVAARVEGWQQLAIVCGTWEW